MGCILTILTLAVNSLMIPVAFAAISTADTVEYVRFNGAGNLVVVLTGNNNGCGGKKILFTSSASKDAITSFALTTLVSGKKFQANYITCSDSPWPNTAASYDANIYK